LYLEFLRAKQDTLENDEKLKTFQAAADWLKNNKNKKDFKIDTIKINELTQKYA
jgi:hypothetical protein